MPDTPPLPDRVAAAAADLDSPACAYIYDLATLSQRIHAVRAALPVHATLLYAMKANSHPDVLARAAAECDGVEVASQGELAAAVAAGASRLAFAGPAKTDAALDAALHAPVPVTINVESIHELRRLDHLARRRGVVAETALRVNRRHPALPGTHRMTGAPTPFGVDDTDLPAAVDAARLLPGIRLTGLHLHAVSNNLDAAAHARFVADCRQYRRRVAAEHDLALTHLNLGGGLGVDPAGDAHFDLDAFAAALRRRPDDTDTTLVFELGRYLVADAGWYLAEVLDVKTVRQRQFAVVRGGTHHFRLPAAWGYDHPVAVIPTSRWPYPWPRPEVGGSVDIVGELCTPRDVLCRAAAVARLRPGDIVALPRTGAYGREVSHHDFLTHPKPTVVTLP